MKQNYSNHLAKESSPYLLQHANNPVDWYPWGDEALTKAKSENKLLVISIGYAACHWCHVMEHESFEDVEVAEVMNRFFVSVKVDREERPDIDQIYMTAAQLMTGRGGWPLNIIALPDGRPIFSGTYFPKNNWLEVLTKVNQYFKSQADEADQLANRVVAGINQSELIGINKEDVNFSKDDLIKLFQNWKQSLDMVWGGSDHAPKFPMPASLDYLLKYSFYSKDKDAINALTLTLDKMAMGGIFDQIGGGFSRYSVDRYWHVPHFEKMLYDNSQLVSLYSSAYQMTKNDLYKSVVKKTLKFIEAELMSKEGAFYSSLDADSEGEEGKFYVWSKQEINDLLGDNADLISEYYSVTDSGNWEGTNILLRGKMDIEFATDKQITIEELQTKVITANQTLLNARKSRIRPALDDKILTAWNALMLKAYVDAYRVFDHESYLKVALRNANFMVDKQLSDEFRLNRNYKTGKSSINGFLDDYAFLIEAFISLYQATFDEEWLAKADKLTEYTLVHFFDQSSSLFFYTSDIDDALIARKMELSDNVIPSSNSVMATNLFMLGELLYKKNYSDISNQMLKNLKEQIISNGPYYANWAQLMTQYVDSPYEVVLVGADSKKMRREFDKNYFANVIYLGSTGKSNMPLLKNKYIKNQTTIYVCQNKSCQLPVTTVEEALNQIH